LVLLFKLQRPTLYMTCDFRDDLQVYRSNYPTNSVKALNEVVTI